MLARLVAFALRIPTLVLLAAAVLFVGGIFAVSDLNVEAYPNPVPPMVEIIVQPDGLGAEEVEKYVTIPLELGLAGMPGLGTRALSRSSGSPTSSATSPGRPTISRRSRRSSID